MKTDTYLENKIFKMRQLCLKPKEIFPQKCSLFSNWVMEYEGAESMLLAQNSFVWAVGWQLSSLRLNSPLCCLFSIWKSSHLDHLAKLYADNISASSLKLTCIVFGESCSIPPKISSHLKHFWEFLIKQCCLGPWFMIQVYKKLQGFSTNCFHKIKGKYWATLMLLSFCC